MPRLKKVFTATVLAASIGAGGLMAGALVDFVIQTLIINMIIQSCADCICWVAAKIYDKYEDRTEPVKNALADSAMPGYRKIKMPKLVRHENFIAIKNMTQAQWTFQVAGLSKPEQEAKRKNEGSKLANLDETGTVTVFKPHLKGDQMEFMEFVGILEAGGEKVVLEPNVDYILYPNFAKKYAGLSTEDNFYRTVYLEDARGARYACNLTRLKADNKKAKFGVTFNSMNAVINNKGLEMDLNNPAYDDMIFIVQDRIQAPPAKAN